MPLSAVARGTGLVGVRPQTGLGGWGPQTSTRTLTAGRHLPGVLRMMIDRLSVPGPRREREIVAATERW